MRKKILYFGCALNVILAVLHMLFWKLLNWSEELPKLSIENQGVMQVCNIIIIFILLYFALMSYIIARRGRPDYSARSIILCISGFYFIRLVTGYPFFGFSFEELFIWVICIILIAGYLTVLFLKEE